MATKYMINYGFESVADPDTNWASEGKRITALGVDSVGLSVGRLEWSAFVQQSRPGNYPDVVSDGERDLAQAAMDGLRRAGYSGQFVLSVDALVPRMLAADQDLAGTDADGKMSREFASAWALVHGPVGDALEAFVTEVARRYQPFMIGLTELMIAEHSFGPRDLELYRKATGHPAWPKTPDGKNDTKHRSLAIWRSMELSRLVARLARAARREGVQLEMDVRAPAPGELRGRPDSGHDYAMLLDAADRLAIWHYIGIDAYPEGYNEDFVRSLDKFNERRLVLSIGLWAGKGTLSPAELGRALVKSDGVPLVSITPASMLSPAHWKVLQDQPR